MAAVATTYSTRAEAKRQPVLAKVVKLGKGGSGELEGIYTRALRAFPWCHVADESCTVSRLPR